jgi:hypothetical protein
MRKLLLITSILFTSNLYAVTFSTYTVSLNPSISADYSTLNAWNVAQACWLNDSTVERDSIAVCNIIGGGQDTTGCTMLNSTFSRTAGNWQTGATNYIYIYTSGDARHNGIYDDSRYVFKTAALNGLRLQSPHIRIDGLQVNQSLWVTGQGCITWSYTGNPPIFNGYDIRYSNCILVNSSITVNPTLNTRSLAIGQLSDSTGTVRVWNNILYNSGSGIFCNQITGSSTFYIYNNTLYLCDQTPTAATKGAIRIATTTGYKSYLYLKNNLTQGTTQNYLLTNTILVSSVANISQMTSSPNTDFQNIIVPFINATISTTTANFTPTTSFTRYGQYLGTDPDGAIDITTDISGAVILSTQTPIGAIKYQTGAITASRRRPYAPVWIQ